MEANAIELLHQKTHRKLSPLAKELGISRKRLVRWINGEMDTTDLTVGEYISLHKHHLFTHILQSKVSIPTLENGILNAKAELGNYRFLAAYRIKFFADKAKKSLGMYYKYVSNANKSINCISALPFGDSSYHLMAILQIGDDSLRQEDLVGFNRYANHWNVRVNAENQRKWLQIAIQDAGSESKFQEIWQESNESIESVHTYLFSLEPESIGAIF